MSNTLADQLVKLGLISTEQAAQASAPPRGRPDGKGPRPPRTERAGESGSGRGDEPRRGEQPARPEQIVAKGAVAGRTAGDRRFYFVTRDGRVPYLELSEEIARRVERGEAAIAEAPNGKTSIIGPDAARHLGEIAPEWLRAFGPAGAVGSSGGSIRR